MLKSAATGADMSIAPMDAGAMSVEVTVVAAGVGIHTPAAIGIRIGAAAIQIVAAIGTRIGVAAIQIVAAIRAVATHPATTILDATQTDATRADATRAAEPRSALAPAFQ